MTDTRETRTPTTEVTLLGLILYIALVYVGGMALFWTAAVVYTALMGGF